MSLGSYREEDVTLLMKDITGLVNPLPAETREPLIQSGVHYSEMLPLEYAPTSVYIALYELALKKYALQTAEAVAVVSEKIIEAKGRNLVLVSLARAGISIGILIKRYISWKYEINVPHYAISIIRGKGIDKNAMAKILTEHSPESIQFVDGWTGKGAIQRELVKAMETYAGIDPGLAVLADPAHIAKRSGTNEDFLIASSCLNATVSGLISRTFYRDDIIGHEDYHGVACYNSLKCNDRTYEFIESIALLFDSVKTCYKKKNEQKNVGLLEVHNVCSYFGIDDVNLVKPGIGETTRVLLRRLPWKVLVHSLEDQDNLGHIYCLANEKGVEVVEYPLECYKACGLIRELADN